MAKRLTSKTVALPYGERGITEFVAAQSIHLQANQNFTGTNLSL